MGMSKWKSSSTGSFFGSMAGKILSLLLVVAIVVGLIKAVGAALAKKITRPFDIFGLRDITSGGGDDDGKKKKNNPGKVIGGVFKKLLPFV